jgi:hypothetical protein
MPGFLRQSTASQSRAIGPFIDDTDFKTPETGLTIANTDIKLVANGGASANKNSGGGTHRVNGVYGVTFDATDTATVGELEVSVVVAGALPVFDKWTVLEEAVYDALFAASAPGYLQPTTGGRTLDVSAAGNAGIDWSNVEAPTTTVGLSGTTVKTATDVETDTADIQSRLPAALVSGRIDASVGAMAANTLTASALATDAVTEIQSGLATSAALVTAQADLDDIQTRIPAALSGGKMDSVISATVDANLVAIDGTAVSGDGSGTPWGP